MKIIKVLLSIFLFVIFISCGSEEGNSLENCKEPKKVVHVLEYTLISIFLI